jgi:hypothetical protein
MGILGSPFKMNFTQNREEAEAERLSQEQLESERNRLEEERLTKEKAEFERR